MPRPHRIEFAGGVFHVTARGNRKQAIVEDDLDCHWLLGTFGNVVRRCTWLCHAYCLMPNHLHLLVETPEPNLSYGMQRLNGRYAQGMNQRYGYVGHLFQGRFYSKLVTDDVHLLELSRYIVLNPTRAGLCRDPLEWPWSSFGATLGRRPKPDFLETGRILAQFGADRDRARRVYELFVRAGMEESI